MVRSRPELFEYILNFNPGLGEWPPISAIPILENSTYAPGFNNKEGIFIDALYQRSALKGRPRQAGAFNRIRIVSREIKTNTTMVAM